MTESERLHLEAMDFCDQALAARKRGDSPRARELFGRAFDAERQAASLLPVGLEPTRAIIHRSAAALAFECGRAYEAKAIARSGLDGNPPEDIAEELRELEGRLAAEVRRGMEGYEKIARRLMDLDDQAKFNDEMKGAG